MKALSTLFVAGMFLTTVAMADDVDDVKAAVERYFAALNTGDVGAYIEARVPEYSLFVDGALLSRFHSLTEQRNSFQASVDAGFKRNYQLRHLEVKVYGDAAVVTAYNVGTRTRPGRTTEQVRERRTSVWIKQGGQWKQVHRHQSPLNLAPSQ
jgi:ketosteroid isomerase-like protein